jgi:hypothetical protein
MLWSSELRCGALTTVSLVLSPDLNKLMKYPQNKLRFSVNKRLLNCTYITCFVIIPRLRTSSDKVLFGNLVGMLEVA